MADEANPKEVVRLTLQPVRRGIDADQRRDLRVVGRGFDAHLEQPVMANRADVVDSLHMLDHVHPGDRRQHLEAERIAQEASHLDYPLWRNLDADDARVEAL